MTELENYKGYSLVFIRRTEKFEAKDKDGKVVTKSSSFSGLKANVDAYIKRLKKLKPFDIINRSDDKLVLLSSVASEDFDEIWVSWKDEGQKRRSRSKEYLLYRWAHSEALDKYFFVVATPENLKILAKIQRAQKSIEGIQGYMEALRLKYTDPITEELLREKVK